MKFKPRYKSNDLNFWFVCDFETVTPNTNYYKENNDSIVILANSCGWYTEKHHTFANIQDFMEYHIGLGVSQTLWFHNLFWDGSFIIPWLINNGYTLVNDPKLSYKQFRLFRQGSKIFSITIKCKTKDKKYFNIYIRDSLALLSARVEDLAKSFGMTKYNVDDNLEKFYDWEPKESLEEWYSTEQGTRYVEYCQNDCLVVLKALQAFNQTIQNLDVVRFNEWGFTTFNYLTAGSISFNLMKIHSRHYNLKHKKKAKYLYTDEKTYQILKPFFSGGYTQFNPLYQLDEPAKIDNGIMIDVSSAYPFHMTKPLPFGAIHNFINPKWKYYRTFVIAKIKTIKIKPKYEELVIFKNWNKVSDNRYCKEHKNITVYYTQEEWEIINKVYDVVLSDGLEYFYMEAEPFLEDLERQFYKAKVDYGLQKNDGLKLGTKILLNSSYGKFAENPDKELYSYYKEDLQKTDKVYQDQKEYEVVGISKSFDYLDYKCVRVKEVDAKLKYRNIAVAVCVTADERCYLWNKILSVGTKHFMYSDTDSILFGNLSKKQMNALEETLTKNELGGWEKEKEVSYYKVYGAKKYFIYDKDKNPIKLKFGGININSVSKSEIEKMSFQGDEIVIKDACFKTVHTKSGLVLIRVDKIMSKGNL